MPIGKEDELAQIVRLGGDRQRVGQAHVLALDVVDRGAMDQGHEQRTVAFQVGLDILQLRGPEVVLVGPDPGLIIAAELGTVHRPDRQLLDLVLATEVDERLEFAAIVDPAVSHGAGQARTENLCSCSIRIKAGKSM